MSAGRSGVGKPPDQKKVYMDWANHYLRKSGHSATLADLKDISDGQFLPQIIQAVVHNEIPGVIATVVTDEDRQQNIEKCIRYLEKSGVNCSTFQPQDIADGNMRAIYSLFYNLSHIKKSNKDPHGEGGASSGTPPTSRIARAISPGLKTSHGVSSGGGSGIPMSSKLAAPSSSSGLSNGTAAAARKNTLPGSGLAGPAHSIGQRRIPQKSHAEGSTHNHTPMAKSQDDGSPVMNGGDVELDSVHQKSRLAKPGSSSAVSGSHSKESKLHHTSVSASNIKPGSEGHTRATPPRSTSLSKLQSPSLSTKLREPAKIEEKGEPLNDKQANEDGETSRPGSRLKHPSSGRTTPSNMSRSGLQRPSSRLAKPGFTGPEEQESPLPRRPDSQLRLQRKGSDGAVKKHRVNVGGATSTTHGSSQIESGRSSLPRNLPKGILSGGSGLTAPAGYSDSAHKATDLESSGSSGEHQLTSDPAKSTSSASVKKTPSLKKATSSTGLRMPTGKTGLTRPSETHSAGEPVREESPPSTGAPPSKLVGPLKKMTSSSSLLTSPGSSSPLSKPRASRLAGPASTSKLLSMKPHPQVASLSPSAASSITGSTSSLESCSSDIIKVGVSKKIDGESAKVGPESDKSTDMSLGAESGSRPPPKSLELDKGEASVKEADILSPPAEFKMLEKRDSRRISPEGMSQEDNINSRPTEAPPTTANDDDELPLKQELSESVERNLKNEREIGGEPSSLVIPRSQAVEDTQRMVDDQTITSQPSVSDSKHTGVMKIGNETEDSRMEQPSKGISQPETGQPAMDSPLLVQKGSADVQSSTAQSGVTSSPLRSSREADQRSHDHGKPRARSLSPKSSHRVGTVTIGPTFLPPHMMPLAHGGHEFSRTASNDITGGVARKPLKSSLRHSNSSAGVGRNSSSSSLEGVPTKGKVTISPRSSQLVYNPEDTLTSISYHLSPKVLSPDSNRPISFGESSNSDSLSPPGSTTALFHRQPKVGGGGRFLDRERDRGGGVSRKESIRSTVSEKLNFDEEIRFLDSGLRAMQSDQLASTPELLESFENQLSSMKMDLANKDRMLTMYESSMADLSSKVHSLRKTLEQKDREIRHLTDEKTTWFDLEGRSLASRAASEAGVLSDGCLSDSAMEQNGKAGKKKKKPWKRFSFRKNKKDGQMDHLSPNMDTESIISTRSSRSLKRNFSNRKTPDLMSISEYTPPDGRYKDLDTKSTYTLDTRSEYGAILPQIGFNDHVTVEVFEDTSPGAKVKVLLVPEMLETTSGPGVNDSGYHGDNFSRQLSSGLHHRDSIGSHSDCSSQGESSEATYPLGMLSVAPEISWVTMDTKISDMFAHHLNTIDPDGALGLSDDSIQCYSIGEQRRQVGNALLPPITPYEAVTANNEIRVLLKGSGQDACDSLSYKTLMNVDSLKSYMDMLRDTHWLVVMGTKGTCKTSLATGLARHLSMCLMNEEGIEEEDDEVMITIGGEVMTFNIDKDGLETPLKFIKKDLVRRVQVQTHPPIILLEGVSECETIEKILVAAEAVPKKPYIIATLCSGSAKGIPLHQLLFHHPIRLITCKPNNGHIHGILLRSLRRQVYRHKASQGDVDPVADRLVNWLPFLLEHLNYFINRFHSSVVDLGPRVFMDCPLQLSAGEIESWFINLWNHFVIPYLMGAVLAGIETYTADPRLEWIDVREFVVETYPWQTSININKLQTLSPEDVSWNHAVRPQQSRMLYYKSEDGSIPEDARSIIN